MAANTLINDLEKVILPWGWYLHRKGKHAIYRHPNGGQVAVNSSKTSGRSRTLANLLATFKRAELGLTPGVK